MKATLILTFVAVANGFALPPTTPLHAHLATTSPLSAHTITYKLAGAASALVAFAPIQAVAASKKAVVAHVPHLGENVATTVSLLSARTGGITMTLLTTYLPAHVQSLLLTLLLYSQIAATFPSLSPVQILALISAMPVLELRGAIPVGAWLGLPIKTVFPVAVLGNMLPIFPLLAILQSEPMQKLFAPLLARAKSKFGDVEDAKKWSALAFFVGIPLPGTGAWTGALASFALGMSPSSSISAIFAGVVSAGAIMSSLTLAGKKGGVGALAFLAFYCYQTATKGAAGASKLDFLEASPHWDQSTVPLNTYKNKAPFTGKVISTKRIVGPKATGETCHIVISHDGDMPYWEGQSYGVIPPGDNIKKPGKPNSVRLYSIASTRYGDDMTGKTVSLCVRRATYWCPELKADDETKKGVCSNFLCDTIAGAEVMMTGPSGKVMLMPEEDPKTDLIMVATGTGIAPYRSFIRRLFEEDTPASSIYAGEAWLFLGVANADALLYDDDWQAAKAKPTAAGGRLRVDYALSREGPKNKSGGKMYIQDKVEEYSDEVFAKLDNGAHIYFCGLKGMMPGIHDMLKTVCAGKGIDYAKWLAKLKKAKQWHVEVY